MTESMTGSKMTIKQAQELKIELSKQIRAMLDEFSSETGLRVNEITLDMATTMDGKCSYWPDIDVSL